MPVYLNSYQYLPITNLNLKEIDQKSKLREHFKFRTIEESENATVKDILEKIFEQESLANYYEGRLWRVDKK